MPQQSFVIDWMILWCHKCKITNGLFFYFSYIWNPWFHLTAFQVILSLLLYFLKCIALLREKNFNIDIFDELLVLFSLFNLPLPSNCALNALSIVSEVDAYLWSCFLSFCGRSVDNFSDLSSWVSTIRCRDSTNESRDGDKLHITKETIFSSSTSFLTANNWLLTSFCCNRYPETDPPFCNLVEN